MDAETYEKLGRERLNEPTITAILASSELLDLFHSLRQSRIEQYDAEQRLLAANKRYEEAQFRFDEARSKYFDTMKGIVR